MLTIGLASVPFLSIFYDKWTEIPVNLPKVESESPIVVILPTEQKPFNMGGGGSSGSSDCWLEIENIKGKHKYFVTKNKIKK